MTYFFWCIFIPGQMNAGAYPKTWLRATCTEFKMFILHVSIFKSLDCLDVAGCIELPPYCFHLFFLAPLGPPPGLPSPCPSPFPFPIPSCSCNFVNALVFICGNLVFAGDIAPRCPPSAYPPTSLPPDEVCEPPSFDKKMPIFQ